MRVVLKADHIVEGGGLTHFNQICKNLGQLMPDSHFYVIASSRQIKLLDKQPNNFEYHYYQKANGSYLDKFIWEKFKLPKIVNTLNPDIFFVPGNFSGSKEKFNCPVVSLVHNIAPFSKRYIKEESLIQKIRLKLLKALTIKSMNNSSGVVFLSDYCRRYFRKFITDKNIIGITSHHGQPDSITDSNDLSILNRLNIEKPYILSVSHIYRYKKIKEMVVGYLNALNQNRNLPELLIAGRIYDKKYHKDILEIVKRSNFSDKVRFLGNIKGSELPALYKNCDLFIFPSALETCSVILIEAMAYGCPIICSNKTVMPEVSANQALYYHPENTNRLADLIIRVTSDSELKNNLRLNLKLASGNYSWKNSTEKIIELFKELTSTNLENTDSTIIKELMKYE